MEELGFEKIELADKESKPAVDVQKSNPSPKVARKLSFNPRSKPFLIISSILGIFLLLLVFFVFQAITIVKDARAIQVQAKVAVEAAKKQNIVLAKEELVKTQTLLKDLKKDMGGMFIFSFIPYVGDVKRLVDAGDHGLTAAIVTANSIIPYADVLGLKGEKSFAMGSAEDRIRLAVKTMGKVVPKIDDIEKELVLAKEAVDGINVDRYPNFWIFKKVRDQISMAQSLTDGAVEAVGEGKPLIKVLPELLGDTKSKKYMVLFQNDAELRPTGGFLTYYTIFRVEEGVIKIDKADDIYKLDASIPSHPKPPELISKYLPKVYSFFIRDSNLSPDFGQSMKVFNEFYQKSSGKAEIDGIITVDTKFLVHLIDILGSVDAAGQTFTAETDKRCNCPQVVYELELNTTKPVNFVRDNRKAIVGELLFAVMQKALKSSPKLYWGKLIQAAITDANNKHILFALNSAEAQRGIDALNWGGKIKPFDGDYLHINDANFGGAKSNLYVTQAVKAEYTVSGGEVTKTLTIDYRNPQPYSDCNLESGGLCLNAILRNLQRVYVPEGSTLSQVKGSSVKVETKKDLGKTYFESFFTVNPLGKAQITYTYKLPFKVDKGSPLPVLIQKQPGTDNVQYDIYVNGKKVESFMLETDKVLSLKGF
jgi:hypothetical protein